MSYVCPHCAAGAGGPAQFREVAGWCKARVKQHLLGGVNWAEGECGYLVCATCGKCQYSSTHDPSGAAVELGDDVVIP